MTFKEEFNKPTPQQQAEADRQYEVARQFIERHPEYKGRAEDADAILTWMEVRDMKMTLEGMEIAYKAVFCGEPEPKVMSPDLFFQKVTPTQHIPKAEIEYMDLISKNVFAVDTVTGSTWIPLSTGINGATTNSAHPVSSLPMDWHASSYWIDKLTEQVKNLDLDWDLLEDTIIEPEKKLAKPVASMPSTWYSDVVEMKTTRRIKDAD